MILFIAADCFVFVSIQNFNFTLETNYIKLENLMKFFFSF